MEPRSWLFLASVTLGGFCTSLFAYHAYYNNKKRSLKSSAAAAVDKKKREIELTIDQGHLDWLKKCTEEFSLPSVDKALRVLLTYAQHAANDMLIFEQIRCIFCNDKQKVSSKYIIDYAHDQYLSEMVSKHKLADKDKAVRIIIDYAMTLDDEATIFEVKRCNHVGICKNC